MKKNSIILIISLIIFGFISCNSDTYNRYNKLSLDGQLSIAGNVKVGETLTANYTGQATVTYSWYANDVLISDALQSTLKLTTDHIGKTIKVKVTGYGKYDGTMESQNTALVSKYDGPNSPANLQAQSPTTYQGTDGKILNVDSTMEYSTDNGTNWIQVTGTEITGLSVGTVLVRIKETTNTNVGFAATVAITEAFSPLSGTVSIADDPDNGRLVATYNVATESVAYQWYMDNQILESQTNSTYTYDSSTQGGKTFKVEVTGQDTYVGVKTSNSLTMISGPVSISSNAASDSPVGTLTANINPNITVSFQWYKNDSPVGSNQNTYDYNEGESKSFKVTITGTGNYFGSITSNPIEAGCVIAGTMIAMADGSYKAVENVKLGDYIKSYDFNSGSLVSSKVITLEETKQVNNQVLTLTTSDGHIIRFVDMQAFFDTDQKKFIDITDYNYKLMIGKNILVQDGNSIKQTSISSITSTTELVDYYEIITANTFNYIADGLLTVIPDSLCEILPFEVDDTFKYDLVKINNDIAQYGLYSYQTFPYNISENGFDLFNLKYLKILFGKGLATREYFEYAVNWLFTSSVDNDWLKN